jgi:dipeptidyl aminopeptidase/acylaminoacyl peptidase
MKRVLAGALALALLAGAPHAPASARPFTVDDLLSQESFGAVAIDPAGRWLVFEQRDRYDRLPRYDIGYTPSEAFPWLAVVDLKRPRPATPLLPRDPASGQMLGPFSPSGRQLVVYRLRGRTWDFGVADLPTGAVRWFDLTPQDAARGRGLQWLSEHELLVIARPDRRAPPELRSNDDITERLPAWWAAAARGETAHTVVGSGIYAAVRPRDPARRLLRLDVRTGAATTLAEGELFDLELSPDRRRVALLESGPDVQPRGDGPVRGIAGLETEATRLSILDIARGDRTAACSGCDMLPQLLAWSPDSQEVLAFRRGADGSWARGRLVRVSAATGAVTETGGDLAPEFSLNPVIVRAGWMGSDPVLFARPSGGTRADWYRLGPAGAVNLTRALPPPDGRIRAADGRHLVLLAGQRPWRVDSQGGARSLAAAPARTATGDQRGLDGARLANLFPNGSWISLGAGAACRLVWADTRRLTDAPGGSCGAAALFAAPAQARSLARYDIDDHGVETLSVSRPGAAPVVVAKLNAGLAETNLMRVEVVRHTGERGEPLTSWVYLPVLPAGAPPPPLIVRPYLGYSHATPPRDLKMEGGFFQNLRMMTGHGYAVLVPSLPNPPGGTREPMANVAARILAVERAAREDPRLQGLFDPDREALLGWSFGGYTVMATLTQTDHFRAAVELSGISDLTAYWSNITLKRAVSPEYGYGSNWATGTVEATQPQMGGPPWSDPLRYQRNSPLWHADKIRTPLLLIHGWRDQIPYAGSQAMFSALFRQGKDAQLVTYWGADHMNVSPGDVRDVWARTFQFLDAHLGAASTSGPPTGNLAHVPANGAPRPPQPPH